MNINELFPRRYASGADLPPQGVRATIETVVLEEMSLPGQRPTDKPVLYVVGATRGIILTAPLARQIAALLRSDETENWPGGTVALYPVPMNVAGTPRVAVRARAPSPTNGHATTAEALAKPDPTEIAATADQEPAQCD